MNIPQPITAARLLLCAALAGSALSCEAGAPANATVSVSDSADVRIVEVGGDVGADLPSWQLSADPQLAIGEADGPPPYQLFRVAGALRLEDGTIVVADNGSRNIRYFDEEGDFIHEIGGEGEGPGEYQAISMIARLEEDTLAVWDAPLSRITVLGADGAVGRVVSLRDVTTGFLTLQHGVGEGSLVGRLDSGIRPDELSPGIIERETTFVRLGLGEEPVLDTLGQFFGGQSFVTSEGAVAPMPLAREGVSAAGTDFFHYSTNSSLEVHGYTWEGRLARVVRIQRPGRTLSPAELQQVLEDELSRIADPEMRDARRALYEEIPLSGDLPAWSDATVDAQGNLWLAEYSLRGEDTLRWLVIDPEGAPVATAVTPADLGIYEIGEDYLLGLRTEESGVEQVVLFTLVKE